MSPILTTEFCDLQLAGDLTYAFAPATLGTCVLSLRANKNAYKDAAQASPATTWADQVQQWHDEREAVGGSTYPYAAQPTAGLRPTYAPQAFQVGALRFQNQRLALTNLAGVNKQNCTLAITGILFTDFSQLLSPAYVSLDAIPNAMTLQADGTNTSMQIQPDANYDAADHNLNTLSLPLSPYTVLTLQSTPAGVVVDANGTDSGLLTAAVSHVGSNGFIGDWSNLNSTLAGGWLGRVLVYSPALSAGDLATLQAGLLSEASLLNLWPSSYNLVAFPGDSLTQGVGHGSITPAQTYPAQTISSLTTGVGFLLAALSGRTIDQVANAWSAGINGHYLGSGRAGHQCVSFWCGTNDIAAGTAGGTVYTDYKAKLGAFKAVGWKVLAFTVMNNGGFSAGNITQQGILNTSLRADFPTATSNAHVFAAAGGTTYADYLIDVQSEPNLQITTNTTYFSDGTHLTQAGYAIVAADVVSALNLLGIT